MQQQKLNSPLQKNKQEIELKQIALEKNQRKEKKQEYEKDNQDSLKTKNIFETVIVSNPTYEFQQEIPSHQRKTQQKQNSNEGLNSQRQDEIFPSQFFQRPMNINDQINFNVSAEFNLDQNIQPQKTSITKTYELIRFCYLFKKQYAIQICRIFLYAIISISIFAFVLDKNNDKKQFYDSFYSSQQITISKNIDGVFPPLMGEEYHLIDAWKIQNFNAQVNMNNLKLQFIQGGILYISSTNSACMDQIKMKWRVFYHNMQIYEYIPTEFQKIDTQPITCLGNSQQITSIMKTVSIWTMNWTSYQLYLLCQSLKGNTNNRSNSLIILKKQPTKIK